MKALGRSDGTGTDTAVQPTLRNNLIDNNPKNIYLFLDPKGTDGDQFLLPVLQYNTIRESTMGVVISDTVGTGSLQASPWGDTAASSSFSPDPTGQKGMTVTTVLETSVYDREGTTLRMSGLSGAVLSPTIAFNVLHDATSYEIANYTAYSITARLNYWGSSEKAWDDGPQSGDTYGSVDESDHLDTADDPILTRLAPGATSVGASVTLYGANFQDEESKVDHRYLR